MKHREVAKRIGALEAAVDCAKAQHQLCKEVFNETGGWGRTSEFCPRELFFVLLDISGECIQFFHTGQLFRLKDLKHRIAPLAEVKAGLAQYLSIEREDEVTMRHTHLSFLWQALEVVEKRLRYCVDSEFCL